jgi:hypothetical protein
MLVIVKNYSTIRYTFSSHGIQLKIELGAKEAFTRTKLTPMVWFSILAVIAVGLAIGLPPGVQSQHQLHISSFAYRLAVLVLLVPYGIIWYTAFYAYAKLKEYVSAIDGSEDGRAFRRIMKGIGFLAFGLIVPTIVSLIFQFIVNHHPGFQPAAKVMDIYLGLLVLLVSFTIIGNGTRRLTNIKNSRPGLTVMRVFILIFISLSVAFTYLVLKYHTAHPHVYYLNTALLIITFIIPYLFSWFVGLLSAYEFRLYARLASGVIYRKALRQLSQGILVTIIGDVVIQFLENTVIVDKADRSIGLLLVLEYILLLIVAAGLSLIALGTKKLKKIEEV